MSFIGRGITFFVWIFVGMVAGFMLTGHLFGMIVGGMFGMFIGVWQSSKT